MGRKRGNKVRVDFKANRQVRQRTDEWTRRYVANDEALADEQRSENVRAKGELSRKRTIIVDDHNATTLDESLWRRGTITAIEGVVCMVDDDKGAPWDCAVRRVLRTRSIAQRGAVTVGDRVWFSDQSANWDGRPVGVIERVDERRSILSRMDRRKREHAIVANADQLLVVTSIAQPAFKPHLVDRYLVAAARGGLRPIVCVNKCDLAPDAVDLADEDFELGIETVESVCADYERIGYRCIRTSATSGQGVVELRAELTGRMTVLSGQSGVGKSSLLNAVQPGLGLAVQEVSEANEKGRHTTTHPQLFRLDAGGYVVDTPGIRQFALWGVPPGELEAFFADISPLVAECRFNDCHHTVEEGCAVRAAAEAGALSERRYYSYLKMLDEAKRENR